MSGKRLRRWLWLGHRWLGIATCLLMAIWFASGLIMVYFPYPSLSQQEWLAGQAPIAWDKVGIEPAAALALGDGSAQRRLVLEMRGRQPVWKLQPWAGPERVFSATTGAELGRASKAEARATAQAFAGRAAHRIEPIGEDQWTVAAGYDAHRPLWKARLAGEGDRHLYLSSTTGAVVLDTSGVERGWNWLGTVPHWIYFTALRQHQDVWRQVVLWLSGPAILGAISGLWIGLLRVRPGRRRFRGGAMTPYHGWLKWHHVAGLAGGLVLLGWIFSGWLSVDPGRLFASEPPTMERQIAYAGALAAAPSLAQVRQQAGDEARRLVFTGAAGRPLLRIERADAPPVLLDAATLAPRADGARLAEARMAVLFPGGRIAGREWLDRPDTYWYRLRGPLDLPVVRLKLDDPAATWVHVHPATGEVLGSTNATRRAYRWLFAFLHLWDTPMLLERPRLRELWIWLFSLLGLITSISGIWLSWKRLARGPRAAPPPARPAAPAAAAAAAGDQGQPSPSG